jgi:hypothetical protein
VHKLYIRQCRCLLELGRILEAQKAFDRAMDAIDRSEPGLPDGIFSYQKCPNEFILEGLGMENVGIFYGHLVYFSPFWYVIS